MEREFISAAAVARLLACNPKHVPKLVARGWIGVRRLPGVAHDRYARADVERLRTAAFLAAGEANSASPTRPPGTQGGRRDG